MKRLQNSFTTTHGGGLRRKRTCDTRGVALLITLILLVLLSAASLATVLLVSGDTMINGFYRNYRGSFTRPTRASTLSSNR